MPEGNNDKADGRALWDRARSPILEALAARASNVDEAELAAYLDGGLDAAAGARVEAALASRPDTFDLLIAAREVLVAGPKAESAAPAALVARAQALLPDPRPPARDRTGRLFAWLAAMSAPVFEPRRALAFAGVAAGFLVVSAAGFELGRAEVMYSTQVDSLLAQDFAALIGQDGEDLL